MASKAIKLTNGTITYLPVTTAALVQYKYGVGSYTTVQQAIGITAGSVADHIGKNTYIAYTTSKGIFTAGEHGIDSKSVKINAGTGVNITNSTTNDVTTLTINASQSHASGSDNQWLSYDTSTSKGIVLSSNNNNGGGNIKLGTSGLITISYIGNILTIGTTATANTGNVTGSGLTANTIITGANNSGIQSSGKTITETAPTNSTATSTVPTSSAVYTAYTAGDTATLNAAKQYADDKVVSAIKFVNTVTTIPTAAAHGEAYLIGNTTSLSVNGTALEPGDMIIAYNGSNETGGLKWATSNTNWTVSSNDITLTLGSSDLQTIATVGGKEIKAKVEGLPNTVVTSSSNLATNAIVLGNGNKTVTTTTSYYPTKSTTSWANDDTKIPTQLAVGKYVSGLGYVTGSGTGGQLAIWKGTSAGSKEIEGRSIQTATWTSGSTNIPTCTAVGAYIAGKSFLTSHQSHSFTNKAVGTSGNYELKLGGSGSSVYFVPEKGIQLKATDSNKLTIGHSHTDITAQSTAALKKIAFDAQGHITGVDVPSTGTVELNSLKYKVSTTDVDDISDTALGLTFDNSNINIASLAGTQTFVTA